VPAQTQRGVARPQQPSAAAANGAYYALIVGINQYPHWPQLRTAVSDAQGVDAVLRQRYGFETRLLLDAQATRVNILNAFSDYRRRLRDNDNLLIYYAGHGARDGGKAYWLPVDSDPDSSANWIIADELTKDMSVIPARHVLVISDSCYSGGLTSRDAALNTAPTDRANYIQTMLRSKSRVLISSGRDEPVADSGSGGHSIFAGAILNGLAHFPDQVFTANNLFSRYVQEPVAGGSAQVPLFQMIQNSGHEYGDFVFVARTATSAGGASAPAPPPVPSDRGSRPTSPNPGTNPSHVSTTRLAPDGRSVKAGPAEPAGYLPLTDYRVSLLEFRDVPETMSDAYIADIAKWQIVQEQGLWKSLERAVAGSPPPGMQINPQRPQFSFEFQKIMDSNPAFAASALLPLFLRPDADWSFLKKEKGWDEQYDAWVCVFLFDHEKIQGRQPEFAGREQVPFLKKQLQMAVAKAPTKFYLTIPLHGQYDLDRAVLRFIPANGNQPVDVFELLQPMQNTTFTSEPVQNLPNPTDRDAHLMLPESARTAATYHLTGSLPDVPSAVPGIVNLGDDPQRTWRKGIAGNTYNMRSPPLGGFAFDRQIMLTAIPIEPARAEPLIRAFNQMRARIYITADRMGLMRSGYERKLNPPQGFLSAHVQKIEIIGPEDQAIATIAGSALPAIQNKK
jgi:hypothetical protein